MIQPQELRIGNWVYPNDENATPYQIMGVLATGVYFGIGNMREPMFQPSPDLTPIPLTPEILSLIGFTRHGGSHYEKVNLGVWVEDYSGGYRIVYFII